MPSSRAAFVALEKLRERWNEVTKVAEGLKSGQELTGKQIESILA